MKRIAAIATTVAVLSLGLAGCSSATPGTMPELPKQDISRWVMPLDAFSSPLRDSLPTYAENRWMETCLGKEGINWPILAQPTDETSAMIPPANMSGFPILTVEVAKQYGYSATRFPGTGGGQAHRDESDKLNAIAQATPGFDLLFESCLKEIRKRLDTISVNDSMNRIIMWQDEAMNAAYAESSVKNAGAAWKKCLVAAGYPIKESAPVGDGEWMPTQALGVSLGFFAAAPSTPAPVPHDGPTNGDGPGGGSSGPARLTAAEVQLAVADATCRESSGWTAAMYQAMWTAEVDQVKQHADDLVRTKTQLDALLKESLAVIAENPPKS